VRRRTTLVWIYGLGVLALIVVGVTLWLTGHGTGDPYLSLGIALAIAPAVVIWLRQRFGGR
jgi:Co/Zn/Cd efflux system component